MYVHHTRSLHRSVNIGFWTTSQRAARRLITVTSLILFSPLTLPNTSIADLMALRSSVRQVYFLMYGVLIAHTVQ